MEELKFVAKCFCFTMILIVLMQVKIGSASIEAYSYRWLQNSTVSQYIPKRCSWRSHGSS